MVENPVLVDQPTILHKADAGRDLLGAWGMFRQPTMYLS